MRRRLLLTSLAVLLCPTALSALPQQLPLIFEQNIGQFAPDVRYATRDEAVALVQTSQGVTLRLRADSSPAWTPGCDVGLSWDGTQHRARLTGERPVRFGVTSIAGRDPAIWRHGVPAFQRVRWADAYPGIDLEFYGAGSSVEYDLVLAPGADVSRIALRFADAQSVTLSDRGDLVIDTECGRLVQRAPRVYQPEGVGIKEIGSRYRITRPGHAVIELAPYDLSQPLTIDPVITWSTMVGSGNTGDDVRAVAIDGAGDVYVLIASYARAFPVKAALGTALDPTQFIVMKLSATGEDVLYATSIGGNQQVNGMALAVDPQGRAWVAGATSATDFPVVSPFQAACHPTLPDGTFCYDSFLLRLNAAGNQIERSTYLGGSGWDAPVALALDGLGRPVIVGATDSTDYPVAAAHQPTKATCPACEPFERDVFVTMLDAAMGALVFSTYLGGPRDEQPRGLAIDATGEVFVSGDAYMGGFPATATLTLGPAQPVAQGFLARYSASGVLQSATLLTGATGPLVAVEAAGIVHLTAQVIEGSTPARQRIEVFRLAPDASTILSTAFAGGTDGTVAAVTLDRFNRDVIVGSAPVADVTERNAIAVATRDVLWRSADGGERYQPAGAGLTDTVRVLAFDAGEPTRAYAGTASAGIFCSTDAGGTWTSCSVGLGAGPVSQIVVDASIGYVYAMTGYASDPGGRRIYITPRGAYAWSPAGTGVTGTMWTLAADPHHAARLYVATEDGLFVSRDGGLTFVRNATAPVRVHAIVVDPSHQGQLYIVSAKFDEAGVYRTTDDGASWQRVYATGSHTGAPSVTALSVAPDDRRVYLATDGGAFRRSDDGGATWTSFPGVVITSQLTAQANGVVWASASTVSRDGGLTWTRVGVGLPESVTTLALQPPPGRWQLAGGAAGSNGFVAVLDPGLADPILASYLPGNTDPRRVAALDTTLVVAGAATRQVTAPSTELLPSAPGDSPGLFVLRIDLDEDPDGDGLLTSWEIVTGLDPLQADDQADADGDGISNEGEFAQGTHPRGTFARYFSEGATNTFFDTTFAVVNADPTTTAHVWFRFLADGGVLTQRGLIVPARTRRTVDARSMAVLRDREFSTVVEADAPVSVDRVMSWNARGYGAHAETGVAAAAPAWYFAEGATHSGFQLFYLLENPNATTAVVTATYLTGDGRDVREAYEVPPMSRLTVWANWISGLGPADVAAVFAVNPTTPIVVERAMYLDAPRQPLGAGHAAAGAPTPATEWFFAEGATGPYFDLFLLLVNPSFGDATADVSYLLPDGRTLTRRYHVPARRRFTIWVDQEDADLADTAVAMRVVGSSPLVAERAMWWPGPTAATWLEGHCAFGSTTAATRWVVADGLAGGPRHAETYALVSNPSGVFADVRVTLLFEDGAAAERTFPMPPHSRTNVSVSHDPWTSASPGVAARLVAGARFGLIIESVGVPEARLVVEASTYWDAMEDGGVVRPWSAGTTNRATPLP